jgi:hypothetical protein
MRSATCRCSVVAALAAVAIGLAVRPASACGCVEFSVCAGVNGTPDMRAADAIFVGRVVDSNRIETRFRVERMFAGESAPELTIGPLTGVAGRAGNVVSSCDMGFKPGESYLVYAVRHKETGDLVTSFCARNKLISDPRAGADLAYLEARAKRLPTNGWVSGIVEEGDYSTGMWEGRRLAGVRVVAFPPAGEKKVTFTNDDGVYFFSGLTPAWRIRAELPASYVPHDGVFGRRDGSETSSIAWPPTLSCAEADVHALRKR